MSHNCISKLQWSAANKHGLKEAILTDTVAGGTTGSQSETAMEAQQFLNTAVQLRPKLDVMEPTKLANKDNSRILMETHLTAIARPSGELSAGCVQMPQFTEYKLGIETYDNREQVTRFQLFVLVEMITFI